MFKKCYFALFLVLILSVTLLKPANSEVQSYYSGDAIYYKNDVIFGSVNMGKLELFKVENGKIKKASEIKSWKSIILHSDDFKDLVFSQEGDSLFVYTIAGRHFYKYNISNIYKPELVKKVTDNTDDWYLGMDKYDNRIATIGVNGATVWNTDMQNIDTFNVKNDMSYNIQFSPAGDYIFNINKEGVSVFSTFYREQVSFLPSEVKDEIYRKVLNDDARSLVYAIDDDSLKKFSLDGTLLAEFDHHPASGNDVDGLENSKYLYFSDGVGVVKINKDTMEPADWLYTTEIATQGGWAMGLNVIGDSQREFVVVFNNLNISVLDSDLEMIDFYAATEEEEEPAEKLFLKVDRNRAAPNSEILLSGGGFAANEELVINFSDVKSITKADENGRFSEIIRVPNTSVKRTDIKVDGKNSDLSYSISFEIE